MFAARAGAGEGNATSSPSHFAEHKHNRRPAKGQWAGLRAGLGPRASGLSGRNARDQGPVKMELTELNYSAHQNNTESMNYINEEPNIIRRDVLLWKCFECCWLMCDLIVL